MATVRSSTVFNGGFGAGTVALTKPTGTTTGDVLVALVIQAKEATTAPSSSGWTLAGSIAPVGSGRAGANGASAVLYRVATASEPTTYSFTTTATNTAAMYAIVGADTTNPIDVVPTWNVTNNSATIVAPTITVTAGAVLLTAHSVLYGGGTVTFGTPSGMTAAGTTRSGNYMSTGYFSQNLTAAGATGTRSSTASQAGTAPQQAVSVAIRNAATVSTRTGAFLPFFGM